MSPPPHRPLCQEGPVCLHSTTSPTWLPLALANLPRVLIDHAHCEKKAAANALSLLQAYPEVPGLAAQMARMAREESGHLARVLEIMERRGVVLTRDVGDPYVQALLQLVRTSTRERLLDRLLIAAVIEARSCERLALLGDGLEPTEPELARFYKELAQSEDGHQALFFRLAEAASGSTTAHSRLKGLLAVEAELLARLQVRPAIH